MGQPKTANRLHLVFSGLMIALPLQQARGGKINPEHKGATAPFLAETGAFFTPAPQSYGGWRGGILGCAGSFVPVLISLRPAATLFRRSTECGGSQLTQRNHHE